MAELILYTNPMSRGRIARWMLEEVGQPYETVVIDYGSTMKGPDYLAVNPMGKVPAIKHRNHVVTECAAICAYLAAAFPDAGLAPRDDERADYYRWLFFMAGPWEQAVTNKFAGWEPDQEKERMFGFGNFDRVVAVVDELLSRQNYVCGHRFTAADVYVGSQIMFTTEFAMVPKTDAFMRYGERLRARDAHKRATAIDDEGAAEIKARQQQQPAEPAQ